VDDVHRALGARADRMARAKVEKVRAGSGLIEEDDAGRATRGAEQFCLAPSMKTAALLERLVFKMIGGRVHCPGCCIQQKCRQTGSAGVLARWSGGVPPPGGRERHAPAPAGGTPAVRS